MARPWYIYGMIATIDKAGRVVVPQSVRSEVGFVPGEVEITVVGTRVQIEQTGSTLREVDGHLLLPQGGPSLNPDEVRELRLADQR